MTAKHTPGPWNCIEQSHGTYICYTDADDTEWNIATMEPGRRNILDDARLIAAAPELLEALKALLQYCVTPRGLPDKNKGRTAEQQAAYDATRAAIAKAGGRGP